MSESETAPGGGLASAEGLDKMKSWASHPAMAANLVQVNNMGANH